MKYATIDENGDPNGFFDDAIHRSIPSGAIKISQDDWQAHVNHDYRRHDGTGWVSHTRVRPIHILRASAQKKVDKYAGAARSRYITDAPGQESIYILKDQQARAFAAAGYTGTVPVLVQADADALGITVQSAADAIIAQADAWIIIAAEIEAARRRGKAAIDAASDSAAIDAARDMAIAALEAV